MAAGGRSWPPGRATGWSCIRRGNGSRSCSRGWTSCGWTSCICAPRTPSERRACWASCSASARSAATSTSATRSSASFPGGRRAVPSFTARFSPDGRETVSRFARDHGQEQRTTSLELFYDLVFVFAITQISHLLLDDLSWRGAGRAALALLVVWWAWQYTTWVTNELDPDSTVVRLLLLGLMLASLVMAIAIPEAFGDKALLFAGSYVAIQVGRHSFLTFAAADAGSIERERAGRILTWFCAAGVLWIAGGAAEGEVRTALWLAALALDYGAPLVLFWVPGRRRLVGGTWEIGTEHFTERFGLFVIIALGESIVL